jgi:hypothetical protein
MQRDIIVHASKSLCKLPVILATFYSNLTFIDRFFKNVQISNFIKIRPKESELSHVARRKDVTKLIVAFRILANAPKNYMRNEVLCCVILRFLHAMLRLQSGCDDVKSR